MFTENTNTKLALRYSPTHSPKLSEDDLYSGAIVTDDGKRAGDAQHESLWCDDLQPRI